MSQSPTLTLSSVIVSDGLTSTQVVTRTIVNTPNPAPTSADSTSITGPAGPSTSATQTPSSAQLSTASIVGIALGSVAAAILLILCVLFALGFRLQRAKWRRHGTLAEATELRDEHGAAASTPGRQHGKAELEDAEYTRRRERLHDGAKPELEGSRPRRSVWSVFSIRSVRKREPPLVPAELGTEPVAPGPHELPGEGVCQSTSEAPRVVGRAT